MSSRLLALAVLLSSRIALAQDETNFKTETNLVLVPVVVRDAKGDAVGNLSKEDFQLFDKGKQQEIAKFAVEETSGQVAHDRSLPAGNAGRAEAAPMAIPDHFVALLFDDLHMLDFRDLAYSRDAATKLLDTLQPADRVAILTTSGEIALDFTADRAKLSETLSKLRYGALVLNKVAGRGQDSRAVVMQAENIVRRMARLPGQRTEVLISPGLTLDPIVPETMQLIDDAVRSRVIVNSLDARGLATSRNAASQEFQARVTDGTGGRFITDTNDLKGALGQLAATPKYIYVLGFSPQMLKPDGSFHGLTVKLASGHKLDLQARNGYWAPGAKEPARQQHEPLAAEKVDAPRVDESGTKEVTEAIGVAAAATKREDAPEATLVTAPAPETPKTRPSSDDEVTTHDEPLTFKVQSNLVEVPVVVRDRQGHAIGNLGKDDFRVFDKGKRQDIAKFYVEKAPGPAAPEAHAQNAQNAPTSGISNAATAPPALPSRFIAFIFDDLHIRFADLPQVREAVRRYLRSSLQPEDRVALYTTSGRIAVDFTGKPEALDEALLKISPSPIAASALRSCLYVSYFQAEQIDRQVTLRPSYPEDVGRSAALKTAVYDTGRCLRLTDAKTLFEIAVQEINDAYTSGKQESRAVLAALSNIVRRMSVMPGQRRIVLVSPGFFVPPELQDEGSGLLALAIRSKVLISAIDARGVWTNPVYDAGYSGGPPPSDVVAFWDLDGLAATDELIALAEGTGGSVNLNNDFDGGVRKATAAPEYLYMLGFAPQNLKADGSFHSLKVAVASGEKVSLQARRGYWAPKHVDDALATAKQEIENAVFSRDEIHNLPVEMHTQILKTGDALKLNVLASVDLKLIHLRKADDRNRNDLTIVATVFDANGNFIAGTQKTLQLRLRDETVQRLETKPPVTIATNFDMQPGAYLVRLVVRDAEGQQLTAENAGVQIP